MNGKLFQFREIRIIQGLLAKGRIPYDEIKACGPYAGILKGIIEVVCLRIQIFCDSRRRGIKLHGQKTRIELFRAKADKITDARRRFKDIQFFPGADAQPGKSLIHGPDDGFRSVMRILGGTAGGSIISRRKNPLQLPIFCRPLLILRIKDLRQATPADKAHQRLLLFRGGQFYAASL